MSFSGVLCSEFFRAQRIHVGMVLTLLYLGVALLYVLTGAGAWVSMGSEGTFAGFCADPFYFDLIDVGDVAERTVAAALAHTVFFPVASVAVVGMFFENHRGNANIDVSRARGTGEGSLYLSRVIVSSAYLMFYYVFFTLILCAIYSAHGQAVDVFLLIQKTIANILINISYVVVCVTAFASFYQKALVSGGLVTVTFAGLIAVMSFPGTNIPVHMFYWMWTCGVGVPEMAREVVSFSSASVIVCAPILYASQEVRRRLS